MVSSSNRMAPVLEVAHVLWRTLIARPVPTVPPVTASDEQTIRTTAPLQYSPTSAGMIEVGVPASGGWLSHYLDAVRLKAVLQHTSDTHTMYYAIVLLLMLVLPAVSITVEVALSTGTPFMALLGKWFVFWAMGIRLLLAGIRQITQPAFTASLLGIKNTESHILVRELGFANFSMGTLATLSLWLPQWMVPAALVGAIFYALAGINHLLQPHRNQKENLAMITDLYAAGVLILVCVYCINN